MTSRDVFFINFGNEAVSDYIKLLASCSLCTASKSLMLCNHFLILFKSSDGKIGRLCVTSTLANRDSVFLFNTFW